MAEVKVFGSWGSPFSRRVELALKLKGVSYEYIEEDLSNKSPLLLKYNPIHKKIPVLLHNEKPIVESIVILEYIDETWKGSSIMPEDPYQRAIARFWIKFIDEKFFTAIWKASWNEGKEQEKGMEETWELLTILENELKGKKFFGGDNIGLVDIAASFIAFWVEVLQEVVEIKLSDEDKFPTLHKWSEEFLSCEVVKECLPPKDKLFAFFQARKKAITTSKSMVYK
ncbi:probable glutathione S-transferase isoform X1 [Telopea speciosissima]|uniref:probable glutathione S-transferase isoform X1 n=1 Tax=Telopea speciosissima TaxID=54955 RepID=UPI001CC59F7F|nr:probable glutathione S-transferase isoform X1 [Telopea speciosissima]